MLGVPYVTLSEYNLVNPYHKQHFNEFSFDFFDQEKLKKSAEEDNEIYFKKISHRFTYLPEWEKKSTKKKEFARRHYFNVVQKIDFVLQVVKKDNAKILSGRAEQEYIEEFDSLLAARVGYGDVADRQKG